MLIMAIERFKNRNAIAVYRQAMERGRLMPEGLTYVGERKIGDDRGES